MKFLQQMISRRSFLKLTAQLSVLMVNVRVVNVLAKSPQQTDAQPRGYGLGAYSHDIYPGTTNKVYLPFISKEQN